MTRSWTLRLAVMVALLVVGPATLVPGSADAPGAARLAPSQTAGTAWGWGMALWDFAWEYGESLASRPYRGSDIKRGRWVESTDGTGRVVKYGGGLEFHSGPYHRPHQAAPDRGTTRLTLADQPARFGRWEVRFRSDQKERGAAPYEVLLELVPEGTGPDECGDQSVTIARIDPDGSAVRIGAHDATAQRSWTRTVSGLRQGRSFARNYAVQVTKGRITWFVDGKVVGSTSAGAAVPRRPMTVRLSMIGQGDREMNKTLLLFDWVRGWDLRRGKRLPAGPELAEGGYSGAC